MNRCKKVKQTLCSKRGAPDSLDGNQHLGWDHGAMSSSPNAWDKDLEDFACRFVQWEFVKRWNLVVSFSDEMLRLSLDFSSRGLFCFAWWKSEKNQFQNIRWFLSMSYHILKDAWCYQYNAENSKKREREREKKMSACCKYFHHFVCCIHIPWHRNTWLGKASRKSRFRVQIEDRDSKHSHHSHFSEP